MAEEVVRIEIECRIIVGHRTTQIALVKAGHSAIDIQACLLRQQVDGLVKESLSLLPFLTSQRNTGTLCPYATVIGIELYTLVESTDGLGGIL